MSKCLYGIRNGENIMTLWENEKLGKVLITNGKLDLTQDLLIRNAETMKDEACIDLKDFILEVFPVTT
jgi:hypothetical protein